MTIGEVAALYYIERMAVLDNTAREDAAERRPLTAAKSRRYAAIAYRAAEAERLNPDNPETVPCGLCRGVRVCDIALHGIRR